MLRAQIAGISTSILSTETAPAGSGARDNTPFLRPPVCFGVCFGCFGCFGCFCCSFARHPSALITYACAHTMAVMPAAVQGGANMQELARCREANRTGP